MKPWYGATATQWRIAAATLVGIAVGYAGRLATPARTVLLGPGHALSQTSPP